MAKIISLIYLFGLQLVFSQHVKLFFYEENSKTPIANVMLYNGEKLIGITDESGIVSIDNALTIITVVKEEFEDVIIEPKIKQTFYLHKIIALEIEEILVKNKTAKELLDEFYETLISKEHVYNFTDNTHFYNLFKTKKDTLFYFNNRLFKGEFNMLTDNQNKVVKHFKIKNNLALYNLNNKSILFFNNFLYGNSPHNYLDIQFVCKNKELFVFDLKSSEEGKYILNFSPNNKNKSFPYKGRIVLDRDDLGIYEFSYNSIINSNTKRSVVFDNKILNYQILNEKCLLIYTKNSASKYDLVTFNYAVKFKSLDKNMKNEIFESTCVKEPTNQLNNKTTLKKINLVNFEIY
jgi:hypothetical protein